MLQYAYYICKIRIGEKYRKKLKEIKKGKIKMINEDFQKGDERGEKDNKGCIQVQEERRGKGWW